MPLLIYKSCFSELHSQSIYHSVVRISSCLSSQHFFEHVIANCLIQSSVTSYSNILVYEMILKVSFVWPFKSISQKLQVNIIARQKQTVLTLFHPRLATWHWWATGCFFQSRARDSISHFVGPSVRWSVRRSVRRCSRSTQLMAIGLV